MNERKTILRILDEVNIKFENLDPVTRKKIVDSLKFFVPSAKYSPKYKLGKWDGTVSYATIGGNSFLNLLDVILPIIYDNGYEIDIEDERKKYNFNFSEIDQNIFKDKFWPKGHACEGQNIILREHQVFVINNFLKNLQSLQEIPTGSGKTLITATLSHLVEKYGNSIIIVPNKQLVEQTEKDYKNLGLNVGVFYGERKEIDKRHTIATWQSLNMLFKSEENKDWIKKIVAVIVDEAHAVKANELKKMLIGNFSFVPIRWGLTGTIPKNNYELYSLVAAIGPVVNRIQTRKLQEQGVLSFANIIIRQKVEYGEFESWNDEMEYLVKDKDRLNWVAEQIQSISMSGNTLVLFNFIETGEYLNKILKNSVFIHGGINLKEREEKYSTINETNNNIILATCGVASVGINLLRIFNLVLFEPGKSFIRTIQSIGRGLRKGKDKHHLVVYDICSTLKYSNRHMLERKRYYKEALYPFVIEKIR
ncbi:MAG: DEAD/DEAH box helicase family protein [Candidatus Dojkabacteria bacterium]|nr:DEAD/DEAH box helicase family protein [Candidatus Dojkabacteria bacterium]